MTIASSSLSNTVFNFTSLLLDNTLHCIQGKLQTQDHHDSALPILALQMHAAISTFNFKTHSTKMKGTKLYVTPLFSLSPISSIKAFYVSTTGSALELWQKFETIRRF